MRRRLSIAAAMAFGLLAGTRPARAQGMAPPMPDARGGQGSLVLHQPIQSGGPAADTAFDDMLGNPSWSLLADDFTVAQPATVRRVVWWGFYNLDNPPPEETMRVRFYDARPADGLPGNVLFEESFLNPSRNATGLLIGVGVLPAEYIYQVDLTAPFEPDANVPFWLEITQIGSPESAFRWEFAFTDQNDFAFMSPFFPDWTPAMLDGDLAFELLSTPEPSSLGLVVIGFFAMIRRGRRSRNKEPRSYKSHAYMARSPRLSRFPSTNGLPYFCAAPKAL